MERRALLIDGGGLSSARSRRFSERSLNTTHFVHASAEPQE